MMPLAVGDRAIVEASRRLEALSSFDAVEAGRHLCDALHLSGHAEGTFYHRPVQTRDGGRVTGHAYRATEGLETWIESFADRYAEVHRDMRSQTSSSAHDLSHLKPIETRAFVEFHRLIPDEMLARTLFQQRFLGPAGIIDQQRLLVIHEGKLLGWIGFLRRRGSPRFSRADRARLAPLVDRVRNVVTAIAKLSDDICPGEPGDLVLLPDGKVEFASVSARGWLEVPGFTEALARHVRMLDRRQQAAEVDALFPHADVRVVRIDGPDGVRYLANLQRCHWRERKALDRLPPSLREVARLVAAGKTDKEIAQELERPLSTTRTYVTRALKRLGVDHRGKLAALFATEESDAG